MQLFNSDHPLIGLGSSGMAKYLVTYDLVGTDETSEDYEKLIKRIKRFPSYRKIQKSVWLIKTGKKAKEVRDILLRLMDDNDRLYVTRISGGSAWHKVICGTTRLKAFMQP